YTRRWIRAFFPAGRLEFWTCAVARDYLCEQSSRRSAHCCSGEAKMPAQATADTPDAPDRSGGDHCSGREVDEVMAPFVRARPDESDIQNNGNPEKPPVMP